MSKYILEIKPDYEGSFKGVMILGAKDSDLFVDTLAVENLEELNSDYINEHYGDLQDTAYKRGLEDGKQVAVGAAELREKLEYQKGFEDGKAIHEKGCDGCKFEGTEIYHRPCCACRNVYPNHWTAKDDKIEVGDEVTHKSDSVKWTAIVTRISCGTLTLMEHSGAIADNYPIEDFVKTGRHFDIASILEAMKHD